MSSTYRIHTVYEACGYYGDGIVVLL